MKSTSLFLAAAFALCANAAFAQTTPTTGGTMGTGTTPSGTMTTPSTSGTMNNGTMNNGTMGTGTMNDRGTMRSNRSMNKGSKMKSKTGAGTTKTTM